MRWWGDIDYLARVGLLPCHDGCFARRFARRHSPGFARDELLLDVRQSTQAAHTLMRRPVALRLLWPAHADALVG